MHFLFSCKHDPPHSNRGHFCSGYLQRERHAGENRILVREEAVLLEEQLSVLLAHAHFVYNIPRSSLQIAHNNALGRNTHAVNVPGLRGNSCSPVGCRVKEVGQRGGKTSQKSCFPGLTGFSSSALPLEYLSWWCLLPFLMQDATS